MAQTGALDEFAAVFAPLQVGGAWRAWALGGFGTPQAGARHQLCSVS